MPGIAADRPQPHTRLRVLRLLGLAGFALWTARYIAAGEPLLHGSLLIFHEAGHVLFMPFGEFMMVLGGSLFQLMVPAFFIAWFVHAHDRFAACASGLYLAASLSDVARYVADARAGTLDLLGGERSNHDWTFLLIEMELLQRDVAIGGFLHDVAVVVFWGSLIGGVYFAWHSTQPAPPDP